MPPSSSEPVAPELAASAVVRRLRMRWLGLLALLLLEYLWVSFRFDAVPLLRNAGYLGAFGYFGILTPLAFVVGTATFALAGRALRAEATALVAQHAAEIRTVPMLLLNALSYAGLLALTRALVSRTPDAPPPPAAWMFGWLACMALTVLSLIPAALPWRALGPLVRHSARVGVLGLGLGIFAWVAGLASAQLWPVLNLSTTATVYFLLNLLGAEVVYLPQEDIIGTTDFFVVVSSPCSGLEGIGFIISFTLIYIWGARERLLLPRAFGLIPLGIVAVWIGNVLRILALICVGTFISPEIALSGFHSKAGWIVSCVVALSMIALVQRSKYFSGAHTISRQGDGTQTWNPTATHVAPLLALIGTSLVTGLFSTGLDHAYALRVLSTGLVILHYKKHLPAPRWPPSWHAPVIGVAVFVAWWFMVPRPKTHDLVYFRDTLAAMPSFERGAWFFFRVLGGSLTVPIAEELAFRGFLLRRLIASDFTEVPKTRITAVALVVSSLAFGSLHNQAWVAGTMAGVAYAFAQRARGRTADAIVAHAITNALIAAAVLAFGADWLWV